MTIASLTLARRITLLAVLVPVAVTALAWVSLHGAWDVGAQYDNLYGSTLGPIMELDGANLARQAIVADVAPLVDGSATSLPQPARDRLRADDATIATAIDHYGSRWISTLRPGFAATIAAAGRQSLQGDEGAAFDDLRDAYTAWGPTRDAIVSGSVPTGIGPILDRMEGPLTALVAVNRSFADLSNATAQDVIGGSQVLLVIAGLLLGALGSAIAIVVGLSIIRPVRRLTTTAELLASGDVDAAVPEVGDDELGRMAAALGAIRGYLRAMSDSAWRLARNDLTAQPEPASDRDALGLTLAGLAESLRIALGEVRTASASLVRASDEVSAAAARSSAASASVAPAIRQLASGSADQARAASDLAGRAARSLGEIAELMCATSASLRQITVALDATECPTAEVMAASGAMAGIAAETGDAMSRMTASTKIVVRSLESMAATSRKNAAVADRAGVAVEQVSAGAAEVVSAAETLAEMARQLDQLVGRFRLDDDSLPSDGNVVPRRRASDWQRTTPAKTRLA